MRKKGFTLIELLVVIAIIALLLSILLPALNTVKEMGRSIVCAANQHSLVLSYIMYSDENDSKLCGSYNHFITASGFLWDQPESWAWAPYDEATDLSVPDPWTLLPTLEQRKKGIELGTLYKYNQDFDLYHCPSDRAQKNEYKLRSYSLPDCLNGLGGPWTNYKKYSNIKSPSSKYVFVEEDDGRFWNMNSWFLFYSNPWRWDDPYLTVWHNDSSNIGYLDGHVDRHKWGNETRKFLSQESKDFFAISEPWGGSWGPNNEYNCTPATPGGQEDLDMMIRGWAK